MTYLVIKPYQISSSEKTFLRNYSRNPDSNYGQPMNFSALQKCVPIIIIPYLPRKWLLRITKFASKEKLIRRNSLSLKAKGVSELGSVWESSPNLMTTAWKFTFTKSVRRAGFTLFATKRPSVTISCVEIRVTVRVEGPGRGKLRSGQACPQAFHYRAGRTKEGAVSEFPEDALARLRDFVPR